MTMTSSFLKAPAIAAAALLALFTAACQPEPAATVTLDSLKTGEFEQLDTSQDLTLPTASFVDASGAPHTFEQYAGKVVVFNIWAEWCAPCVEEMPSLAALQKSFDSEDVVVVPVAFGYPDARDSANALLKKLVGEDLPFYYDDAFNVNAEAQSGAFPSTIIYDRSGKEAARLMLPADWASDDAKKLVQAVLDGAA
jgi:thiol-disulfide isomerase/thioredoxin